MKHLSLSSLTLRALAGFSLLCLLDACAPQSHMAQVPPSHIIETAHQHNESFDVAEITSDKQLSEMRGGFLYAGGLTINFGLISSTSINGIIQSSLSLSTNNLNGKIPESLQQMIQTGTGNTQTVTPTLPAATPSVTPQVNIASANTNNTPAEQDNLANPSNTPTSNAQIASTSNTGMTIQQTTLPSSVTTPPVTTISNNVLTIVQNTANNQVIQNQNILNITVQNLHNYSSQVSLASQRLPLVLSLH